MILEALENLIVIFYLKKTDKIPPMKRQTSHGKKNKNTVNLIVHFFVKRIIINQIKYRL